MTNLATTQPADIAGAGLIPPAAGVTLSASAARRINQLNAKEAAPKMFRVTVSGGGCSGFQYGFQLDYQLQSDDLTFERDGAVLVTDETSLGLIAGAEIDFVDDLMGAYFQVRNPNATSSCGCGTSFSIG
jgi:iron-sulfur cluster insertion protein